MKCLFVFWVNRKNIINLLPAESANRVVKVKQCFVSVKSVLTKLLLMGSLHGLNLRS